mmetsp:Transcript_18627/g.33226  ORF Transcript_18627/g.33226 Transcript_18627/m.33226 type:complete len:379 (-) Transcript_18627:235-1371(-)
MMTSVLLIGLLVLSDLTIGGNAARTFSGSSSNKISLERGSRRGDEAGIVPLAEAPKELNNRPLVGIVSQALPPSLAVNQSYIAASYVKFVEMAGGRAVPFTHDMTEAQVVERFNQVNAILLPGGGAIMEPGHGYYDISSMLLKLAIQANDRGDFFPMLGTCLGFEFFTVAISGNTSILGNFDAGNIASRLEFTPDAAGSRFFSTFSPELMARMADAPLTMENHQFAISPRTFLGDPALSRFFRVLSTSKDKQGVEYVSTVEAREYPFLATQWHAEKNAFEWASYQANPHSPEAVEVTFSLARNLLNMARRNFHKPVSIDAELALQIYNYPVLYSGRPAAPKGKLLLAGSPKVVEGGFVQVYVFNDTRPLTSQSGPQSF